MEVCTVDVRHQPGRIKTKTTLMHSEPTGNMVRFLVFSRDGALLACVRNDARIEVWGGAVSEHKNLFGGGAAKASLAFFGHDGTVLASACGTEDITLWDVARNTVRAVVRNRIAEFVCCGCFDSTGARMSVGYGNGAIGMWQLNAHGGLYEPIEYGTGSSKACGVIARHTKAVVSLCFSSCGTMLASGSTDGSVCLWHQDGTTENYAFLERAGGGACADTTTRVAHSASTWLLCFNASGTLLVSGSAEGIVRIWSTRAKLELRNISAHLAWFSPDGAVLVTSKVGSATLSVWNGDASNEVLRIRLDTASGSQVCFGKGGRLMLAYAVSIPYDSAIYLRTVHIMGAVEPLLPATGWCVSCDRFAGCSFLK